MLSVDRSTEYADSGCSDSQSKSPPPLPLLVDEKADQPASTPVASQPVKKESPRVKSFQPPRFLQPPEDGANIRPSEYLKGLSGFVLSKCRQQPQQQQQQQQQAPKELTVANCDAKRELKSNPARQNERDSNNNNNSSSCTNDEAASKPASQTSETPQARQVAPQLAKECQVLASLPSVSERLQVCIIRVSH